MANIISNCCRVESVRCGDLLGLIELMSEMMGLLENVPVVRGNIQRGLGSTICVVSLTYEIPHCLRRVDNECESF